MMIHKGVNQDDIQELNRALILQNLRKKGICSRAALASQIGLKQATITNIVKDFIDWGLITETGFLNGNKGRRSIGITINNEQYRILGIRLSRKFYRIGVFNLSGDILDLSTGTIPSHPNTDEVLEHICSDIDTYIQKYHNYRFLAIGAAVPGPLIARKNQIALLSGAEEWNGVNIKEILEKKLQMPVFLEHDSNAGAFAHMWKMKEAYQDEILMYISVGPGIGAGIIIDNELYKGSLGIAGEIGHTSINPHGAKCLCGNHGCLELYSSSTSFLTAVNAAKKYDNEDILSLNQVADLIRSGDGLCTELYTKACQCIGYSIVNIIYTINPDIIIIGDEMAKIAPDIMYQVVFDTIKERVLPDMAENITLRINTDDEDDMLIGAAMSTINKIFHFPELYIGK